MATLAVAQEKKVTGKITSADDGSGLPGVNVLEKGTGNGAVSDADGNFSISVGNSATLVFSFVGYKNQEIVVGNQTTIDVRLENDVTALSEVVVVGYGTSKVKDLTGSVASITRENFTKGVIATPDQLLQGRTPGVIITPSSGEPGAASTINIRGTSSIIGNNLPLYVVDGVPLDNGTGTSGTTSGIEGTSTPKNPLIFLNPADIESMTVLKDASAAAIYGSRAANGVVIITTKSGKGNGKKGEFSLNAYVASATARSRYDLLNGPDFLKAVQAANISAGVSPAAAAAAVAGPPVNNGANTNWQDQIYRQAMSQGYNLGWGMSTGKTSLQLSGNIENQEGILKNSSLQRMTGRVNFTTKFLDDRLTLNLSSTVSNIKDTYPPNTNNAGYQGSLIGAMVSYNPTNPIYSSTGPNGYFDLLDGNRNPVAMLNQITDSDNINRTLSNLNLSYKITDGLVFKSTFGLNTSQSLRKAFADPRIPSAWNLSNTAPTTTNGVTFGINYNNPITGNGRATYQYLNTISTLFEETLTYDKVVGNGTINALAGYSFQKYQTDSYGNVGWGLKTPVVNAGDPFIKDINNFTNIAPAFLPQWTQYTIQSFFARVNYSHLDKYLLTGTIRVDGSSKFGSANPYGVFPAAAFKWRVLKEAFAENSIAKAFSDLSFRVNYGQIGNQDPLSPYSAVNVNQTMVNPATGVSTTALDHQGNSKLKWEVATTQGVGLDWAIKSRRLSGTIDYFHTERSNMIFFAPVPGGFSASSNYYKNLDGIVVNSGVEFSFHLEAVNSSKFNWNIDYNMTFYNNTTKNFTSTINTGQVNGQGLSGAYAQTITNGASLYTFNMPIFTGFDANGYAQYADGGKNHLVGSALPKFAAGLTNNFSYGNWSLQVFLQSQSGFYVYNNTANALFLKGSVKTAHNVTYGTYNSPESGINPGSVSTRFLEKGDFVRLQNVQLNYRFNLKSKAIHSLALSLSGQNLALWTKYSGLDPQVNVDHSLNGVPSRGFDYVGYPMPKTYTLGVNMTF
jgi:iron complex outermembrane receptor protein